MLEVIGAAPGTSTEIDWHSVWRNSPEYKDTHLELDRLRDVSPQDLVRKTTADDKQSYREFAASFAVQFNEVFYRVCQQYWRTPSYIYAKTALCVSSSLVSKISIPKSAT